MLEPEDIVKLLGEQRAQAPREYRVKFDVHDLEFNDPKPFAEFTITFASSVKLTDRQAAQIARKIIKMGDDLRVKKVYEYPISLGRVMDDETAQ